MVFPESLDVLFRNARKGKEIDKLKNEELRKGCNIQRSHSFKSVKENVAVLLIYFETNRCQQEA